MKLASETISGHKEEKRQVEMNWKERFRKEVDRKVEIVRRGGK